MESERKESRDVKDVVLREEDFVSRLFFQGLFSFDEEERASTISRVSASFLSCLSSLSSPEGGEEGEEERERKRRFLVVHLPTLLRLSLESPFPDVASQMSSIFSLTKVPLFPLL